MLVTIKNSRLSIGADTYGAELNFLRSADGIDYLWDGKPEYWSGRAPILFPFVGRLRNGRASSAMGDVVLPIHGFAQSCEWEPEKVSPDSMTFKLCSNEQTRTGYPYDFTVYVSYYLSENSLTTEIKVVNAGSTVMPFCTGGHPGFHVPLIEGENFTDYIIEFEKSETADCPFVDMSCGLILNKTRRVLDNQKSFRLEHGIFDNDALIFDKLLSRSASLLSTKSGHGVKMDFDGMKYFAVWSAVKPAPFVCLEPWTGMATTESEDDVFENKRGMRLLEPGEEDTVSFKVTVF